MARRSNGEHHLLWQIENFSACNESCSYCLKSPVIRARCLDDSEWNIVLESRKEVDDNFINIVFFRNKHDQGPIELHLDVKVCLIDLYGKRRFKKRAHFVLKRHRKYIFWEFAKRSAIFDRKDIFLPNDVLTLLVRARKSDCDTLSTSVAGTEIDLDRSTFLWKIRRLSELASANKRVVPFESSMVIPNDIELTCEYDDDQEAPGREYGLRLAVRPKDSPQVPTFMLAKIQALDNHLNPHGEIEAEHVFEANSEGSWHLPSFDTTDRMKVLLEKDRLYLDCNFFISDGTIKQGDVTSIALADEFHPEARTLREDIASVYKRIVNMTPDIELSVCDRLKHVSAHKLILSARSPVFREALSSFEIEKKRSFDAMSDDAGLPQVLNEVCVRRESLSVYARRCKDYARVSNTPREVLMQMLQCMYTDTLRIGNESNAMDLYSAGVRFDFGLLRKKSEVYLMYKISLKSFHLILEFAHSEGAVRLKSECLNFISRNWGFVLASQEWIDLRTIYEDLAQEVLNMVKCEESDS